MTSVDTSRRIDQLKNTNLRDLLPQAIIDAARNPEKIEIKPIRDHEEEMNMLVVEHDYGGLTDEVDWAQWIHDIENTEEEPGSGIVFAPHAPPTVNRLHAIYRDKIQAGELSLSDRILLTCKLRFQENGAPKLYVADYDGEKGLGGAIQFYTKILPSLAKQLGIRFIVGQNDGENLSFFTDKIGRCTYDQLKPTSKALLFPDSDENFAQNHFTTIQFIYPEDIQERVLEKER